MMVLLIHKETGVRSLALADGPFPPKEVLKACIIDMANQLNARGIDIRQSKQEDFMIVDSHGQGYRQENTSHNLNNFSFHFG